MYGKGKDKDDSGKKKVQEELKEGLNRFVKLEHLMVM